MDKHLSTEHVGPLFKVSPGVLQHTTLDHNIVTEEANFSSTHRDEEEGIQHIVWSEQVIHLHPCLTEDYV